MGVLSQAMLWLRSLIVWGGWSQKLFILSFWKPCQRLVFKTHWKAGSLAGATWSGTKDSHYSWLYWCLLAHWIPRFSDSSLSRTKLYHKEFHFTLNLQMKSNLVYMLQWCKSKPLTFLLIAKRGEGFRSAKILSPSYRNRTSEDQNLRDTQYFGSHGSALQDLVNVILKLHNKHQHSSF